MKQDMNGVRTAQDLEQKYNLGVIDEIKKETQKNTEQITSTNNELKDFTTQVTKDLGELQDQIDGNIMTWFQSGVPTLDNYPANEWVTDEEKNNHLGDLYYDKDTGYAYRFTLENGIYNWLKLTDSDIAEALAVANAAQDTADSKRRVFLEQPTPPYDNGDMWIKDKEIWICQISKAEGESFAEKDFINDLKYTDDTVANQVGENLTILSGTVLEIRNDVDEYSRTLTETQKIVNEQGEEIGTLNTKYSSVEQSVNSLEQQVSEIQTFINYVEGNGSITLENTSNTNLYKLSIKGDISLLFGNDGQTYGSPPTQGVPYAQPLYPSPNLFSKNMNLIIEYTEDDKEVYNLPFKYLNYLSQEVADEFVLEDGKAKIIRRVGINSSMQKYELPNEVLEELGDFTIPLKEGNPKIYLQCFDSAIYNATYMIKNAYTEEFATKVELNSSITQTKEQINLEVSKKIDENEVIASINLTSEEAKINASKITLEGIVTANENFKVLLDGSIEAKNGTFSGDITSNNAVITGGSLTVGSKFKVTSDGTLTATGGTFSGSITASSGKIGGATIDGQGVFFNSGNNGWGLWGTTNHANIILHAGANSSNIGGAPFRVLTDGTVYATKANITGAITATSGKIAGFNIGSDRLYYGNTAINRNGNVEFRNDNGYFAIGSRSVNLHGSGMQHPVTISDMLANSGTGDVNASIGIRAYYGNINISSNEYSVIKGSSGVYINDQFYAGSSSKNTKENIKKLKENETNKIYELVKNLEVYQYDYKKEYSGRKDNVGFMIEDIEETILEKFLHVHQDNDDNNKKNYNNEDLIKILLVVIKELQKKIDKIGG